MCRGRGGGAQGSGCLFSRPLFESIVFRQLRFLWREQSGGSCQSAEQLLFSGEILSWATGLEWAGEYRRTLAPSSSSTTPTISNSSSSFHKSHPITLEALPHNARWRVAQRNMKRARECLWLCVKLHSSTWGTVLHPKHCFGEVCEDPIVRQTKTLNSVLKKRIDKIWFRLAPMILSLQSHVSRY